MIESRPTRSPASGFTLLEVLLAIAIGAFVLVAINGIFFGALRLRNKTTEAVEAALPVERALNVIQRDLENIVPPGGKLSGTLQTAASTPRQQGQVSPDFLTATGALGDVVPWAEVQKVAYLLVDSTNGAMGHDLFRSVSRNLLPPALDLPEREWLLSGVESVAFLFHDGVQWQADWDSTTEQTPLPSGIKLQLQLASKVDRGELPELIELVVPLMVAAGTNSQARSSGGAP